MPASRIWTNPASQLTGNGGVSLASTTFDLYGAGESSSSTYITVVNPLTSNATYYGPAFQRIPDQHP